MLETRAQSEILTKERGRPVRTEFPSIWQNHVTKRTIIFYRKCLITIPDCVTYRISYINILIHLFTTFPIKCHPLPWQIPVVIFHDRLLYFKRYNSDLWIRLYLKSLTRNREVKYRFQHSLFITKSLGLTWLSFHPCQLRLTCRTEVLVYQNSFLISWQERNVVGEGLKKEWLFLTSLLTFLRFYYHR